MEPLGKGVRFGELIVIVSVGDGDKTDAAIPDKKGV
jgi:hypothetical protein